MTRGFKEIDVADRFNDYDYHTELLKMFDRILRDERGWIKQRVLSMPDNGLEQENILDQIIYKIWRRLESRKLREEAPAFPLMAEKIVRHLIRQGVPRDKISFHDGEFRVQMDHFLYRIRRNGFKYLIRYDMRSIHFPWTEFRFSPEVFAGFLLAFDATMPEMIQHFAPFMDEVKEWEREEQKRRMIWQIREMTVNAALSR